MMTNVNEPHLSPPLNYAQEWQEIWANVLKSNQETLNKSVKTMVSSLEPQEALLTTIFDPEIVLDTLNKALKELSNKPESLTLIHTNHFNHVLNLMEKVTQQITGGTVTPLFHPHPKDKRFKNPLWGKHPSFFFMQQLYLLNVHFLQEILTQLEDLDPKTAHKLRFYMTHLIDAMSPTNFPLTNPDVIQETYEKKGENLIQGFKKFLTDSINNSFHVNTTDMTALKVGKDIATTPGHVIFRNDLFELIEYSPTTKTVYDIPFLIIPPWINKFYIFDLKPEHSFVRWAVDKGFRLFMVSWVNPHKKQAKKTLADYILKGAKEALDVVKKTTGKKSINMIGYCTGGVLLTCLMAYLKEKGKGGDIKSATLIATPIDFHEAGDLLVYICEEQLKKLESHTKKKGYISSHSMIQSFNLLRANDLIWSFYIHNYLMGKEPIPFDMLYWNNDATRMPARMHVDFLRRMYLHNKLMQPGGVHVGDVPINLTKITTPLFIMGAIDDHIAPWRSVFPLTHLVKGKTQFVLSGSGHVAGVFNHPLKDKYHFWTNSKKTKTANEWLKGAEKTHGSWWPVWEKWAEQFIGSLTPPLLSTKESSLGNAPGHYVMMK